LGIAISSLKTKNTITIGRNKKEDTF